MGYYISSSKNQLQKNQSVENSVIKAPIILAKVADKLAVLEKEVDDS